MTRGDKKHPGVQGQAHIPGPLGLEPDPPWNPPPPKFMFPTWYPATPGSRPEGDQKASGTRGSNSRCTIESDNVGSPLPHTLRGIGNRGVRNTEFLSAEQKRQLYQHVGELGLNAEDFIISTHVSAYSDNWDKVFLGPNMFAATEGAGTVNSVFESMTPRAAIAHEAGHMLTTRAGLAFEAGSLLDEVNASLTGRTLPGLNSIERYQLLRDAAERARLEGRNLRDVLNQMQAMRSGR